jgi:hypothetical protein
MLNPMRLAVLLLLTIFGVRGVCQDRTGTRTAKVTITATDEFGTPLRSTVVDVFANEEGPNRADLFRDGSAQNRVPFGNYRVTVHADDFRPSTFYIEVAAPEVLITAGLEWYGVENQRITARLRGKLASFPSVLGDFVVQGFGSLFEVAI